ncbi:MAG: DUF3782 domain-containing protein [Cyanobacteria bacterium P01_H01_bin.121]
MSESITLEDFYKLFQESERLLREAIQVNDAKFQQQLADLEQRREAAEQQRAREREAAEQRREAAEQRREAAEQQRAREREAAEQQRAREREAAEQQRAREREAADERLRRRVEQTSRAVDNLTTRWGTFVENLVEPGLVRLLQERGIEVGQTQNRLRTRRQGTAMEIDILAVDGNVAVAVEVKSRLNKEAVDDFVTNLQRFKQAFPQYQGYILHGAVAGIEILAGVDMYAYRQGLFVIKQSGDTVVIANDQNFRPTSW